MSRDALPLAEGQLGFPLERREIVAPLGKEKAGSTWEGLFTIVSALGSGHGPSLLLGRAEYITNVSGRRTRGGREGPFEESTR